MAQQITDGTSLDGAHVEGLTIMASRDWRDGWV